MDPDPGIFRECDPDPDLTLERPNQESRKTGSGPGVSGVFWIL